ncbi:glutathione S-transferase family protein [Halioxenophilus sp. WMMB6]|uniref:glutathione S-transferase family protein n=1 Tax=Halioxenophilus sp. WMMB6 TaxID=3073815 RepID=UPI00295ED629|nr:glutathione S-transferase family protein [Halioxenophilus sp. WMMB6]
MKIYSFPTFNLTKLLYTAEELGQDYELVLLDPSKMEHKSPEHLLRHPLGKVPALEWQGKCYFESNNLCRLMAELNGNRLYGDTPEAHAVVNQWIDFFGYQVGKWMMVYAWEEAIKPAFFKKTPDANLIAEAAEFLAQQLPIVDDNLTANEFLAGAELTIADTTAFALTQIESFTSLDLGAYPNLVRWYGQMAERPATARGLDKLPGRAIFPFLQK